MITIQKHHSLGTYSLDVCVLCVCWPQTAGSTACLCPGCPPLRPARPQTWSSGPASSPASRPLLHTKHHMLETERSVTSPPGEAPLDFERPVTVITWSPDCDNLSWRHSFCIIIRTGSFHLDKNSLIKLIGMIYLHHYFHCLRFYWRSLNDVIFCSGWCCNIPIMAVDLKTHYFAFSFADYL